MFERFTKECFQAIEVARDEAIRISHPVGSGHILVGLMSGNSVAARILYDAGINLELAKAEVSRNLGDGSESSVEVTYTKESMTVLENAWEVSQSFDDTRIRAEHVLIALLRDEDSSGYQILQKLNIDRTLLERKTSDYLRTFTK